LENFECGFFTLYMQNLHVGSVKSRKRISQRATEVAQRATEGIHTESHRGNTQREPQRGKAVLQQILLGERELNILRTFVGKY
jgi:hypothetical protein